MKEQLRFFWGDFVKDFNWGERTSKDWGGGGLM